MPASFSFRAKVCRPRFLWSVFFLACSLAQLVVAILLKRQGSVKHFLEGIFCRESSSLSLAASSFVASIAFCVAMTDAINLILDAIDGAIYCGKM